MRYGVILYNLGKIALVLVASMLLPEVYALYYKEGDISALAISQAVMLVVGGGLMLACRRERGRALRYREGFAIAALGWLLAATLGALPYILSGCLGPVDAFMESMSGFSTTGITSVEDMTVLPKGILIWRGLTHWLGGMGIVVLLLAVVAGNSGAKMFKAESPGNALTERAAPKIGDTAKILWGVYVAMSALVLVVMLLCGMEFIDAMCMAFGVVSTGGFASPTVDMAFLVEHPLVQFIVMVFMIMAGGNFAFYYLSIVKRRNYFLRSEEFRVYLAVMAVGTVLMTGGLLHSGTYAEEGLLFTVRQAMFQVVGFVSTAAYCSADYTTWPAFCQMLMFCLYFCGGCAGSTSGSVKVSRVIIAAKNAVASLGKALQPKLVTSIRLNRQVVPQHKVDAVMVFFAMYAFLLLLGALVVSWDGLTLEEALSVSAAMLTNIGQGFGGFAPGCTYAAFSAPIKIFLAFYMMIGRLELMTVLVLFTRHFWRK